MRPVVRSLILKGFRSLANVRIDFDNPTFLIGRNGAGKSNIGDALRFISEAMNSPLKEVIDRRGGITSVRTKVARRQLPRSLGIGVICGTTEDLPELAHNRPANRPANGDYARYSFEIGPLKDYDFEILREQCVVHLGEGKTSWFERRRAEIKSTIQALNRMDFLQPGFLAMPVFAGFRQFLGVHQILSRMKAYAIEPAALREMQDPESGTQLRTDGRNAASVFEEIQRHRPESIPRIKEILSAIVPNTTVVDTVQHREKIAFEFSQEWGRTEKLSFEAYNMSDGTLKALGLLLAVFQVAKPSLIFVEEPESSIHPGAAAALLDTLRYASSRMQVVVSTHSPELLDAKWITDNQIRAVVWKEGETYVQEVPENARRALRAHLTGAGELMRSDVLEPDRDSKNLNRGDTNLFEEIPW